MDNYFSEIYLALKFMQICKFCARPSGNGNHASPKPPDGEDSNVG